MLFIRINGWFRAIVIATLLGTLLGCQLTTPLFSDEVVIDDLSLQDINKQNDAIKIAISKLETGKQADAKAIIDQILRINPSHSTAKLLKKQLTKSYTFIFKTERTTPYKVQSGDSLGSISNQWLGDSIYFVSLAVLNKIENPDLIKPGQIVNIPVLESSPLVKKEKRRSRANLNLLKNYIEQKKYLKSLARMNDIYNLTRHQKELMQLQKSALDSLVASKASISERHHMIDQVKVISAQSKRKFLSPYYQHFIQTELHAVLLDEFLLLFDDKSYYQSADKLIAAKAIKRVEKQQTEVYRTEKLLINKLHEDAIILRKNQQLEAASSSWNKILKIQPGNELALKYYHRTKKLLEKLSKLN